MATWVVGDIHGCAEELERLLDELALGAGDGLVALGDLFHRGPDPLGVARLLARAGARFVLGNHEHALLARLGDGRAPAGLTGADLNGDAGRPLCLAPEQAGPLLAFLRGHAGYFLESNDLPGAGPTRDGRAWCAVHAGLTPGQHARSSLVEDLVQREPLVLARDGRTLAIGLDTGVLYGGRLTAYSPERDEFRSVRAARSHANR